MIGEAIHVKCNVGKVEFSIPWKRVHNWENVCSRCPLKHKCKNRRNVKVKVFDVLRSNIKEHTVEVMI